MFTHGGMGDGPNLQGGGPFTMISNVAVMLCGPDMGDREKPWEG